MEGGMLGLAVVTSPAEINRLWGIETTELQKDGCDILQLDFINCTCFLKFVCLVLQPKGKNKQQQPKI